MGHAAVTLIGFAAVETLIVGACWRWLSPPMRRAGATPAEAWLTAALVRLAALVALFWLLGAVGGLNRRMLIGLQLGAAALAFVWRPGAAPAATPRSRSRPFEIALAGCAAVALLLVVHRGAQSPPNSWDGLAYHLPIAATMLQEGAVAPPLPIVTPFPDAAVEAFPRNVEMWQAWVLAFSGGDRWVDLAQLPLLGLAMLAVFCLARSLGAADGAARIAALLFPFAPVVLDQVTTAYTDVAFTAFLLAATALATTGRRSTAWPATVALGCGLGLLGGTKVSGPMLGLVVGAGWVAGCWASGVPRLRIARSAVGVAAISLLIGAPIYVRNLTVHGNPLFPFAFDRGPFRWEGPLGPRDMMGVLQTADLTWGETLWASWSRIDMAVHSGVFGGFGSAWPVLGSIGLLAAGLAIRRRHSFVWLTLGFAVLFLLTPLQFRVRFTLYLLGWACVGFALLYGWSGSAGRRALEAAALVVVAHTLWLFAATNRPVDVRVCDHVGVEAVYYNRGDLGSPLGEALLWVRNHAPPTSTVLAFPEPCQQLFRYCLWNADFSNRVEVLRADSEAELLARARAHPTTWLVLPKAGPEIAFAHHHPEAIRPIFSNARATVAVVEPSRDPRLGGPDGTGYVPRLP